MNSQWLIMLFFLFSSNVFAQQDTIFEADNAIYDTVNSGIDSTMKWWEEGYYDSIPVGNLEQAKPNQSFGEMASKYQEEDFHYMESVADRLSFIDRVVKRFWDFMRRIFPHIDGISSDTFYNILGVIGIVLIAYLVYKFFIANRKLYTHIKKDSADQEEQISFVERNLLSINIQEYIKEAEKNNHYALAIRYQQLLNIQVLAHKDLIDWSYTKTNLELMEEVKDHELKQDFKACSSIFDYVWFGDFSIDEAQYKHYVTKFENFQSKWS